MIAPYQEVLKALTTKAGKGSESAVIAVERALRNAGDRDDDDFDAELGRTMRAATKWTRPRGAKSSAEARSGSPTLRRESSASPSRGRATAQPADAASA